MHLSPSPSFICGDFESHYLTDDENVCGDVEESGKQEEEHSWDYEENEEEGEGLGSGGKGAGAGGWFVDVVSRRPD